jgi:hypothetical protein
MRRFISASCRGRWSDSPPKDLPAKAPTTDTIRASVCPNVALVTAAFASMMASFRIATNLRRAGRVSAGAPFGAFHKSPFGGTEGGPSGRNASALAVWLLLEQHLEDAAHAVSWTECALGVGKGMGKGKGGGGHGTC